MKNLLRLALLLLSFNLYSQVGINTTSPVESLHIGGVDSRIRVEGLSQVNNVLNTGLGNNLMVDSQGNIIIKEVVSSGGGSTIVNSVYSTLEEFGAVGDGVTDDSVALQLAIDSGKPLFVTKKTFRITETILVSSNLLITGGGGNSIVFVDANKNAFRAEGINNSFSNFSIIGNGVGTSQDGIKISGNYNYTADRQNNIITGMRINNLGGAGINSYKFYGSDINTKYEGSLSVSNCIISDCNYGISNTTRAEYNLYTNIKIQNCHHGFYTNSGNVSFIGGAITGCDNTGVNIGQGANDGHSQFVGTMINHNATNVLTNQDRNYTFSACTIYVGNIKVLGSGKTMFRGCDFYLAGYTLHTNGKSQFNDCEFNSLPSTYTGSVTPIIRDCFNDVTEVISF